LNAGLWGYDSWHPTLHALPRYTANTTLLFLTSYTFEESEDDYDTVMQQTGQTEVELEVEVQYRVKWLLESQINTIYNQYTILHDTDIDTDIDSGNTTDNNSSTSGGSTITTTTNNNKSLVSNSNCNSNSNSSKYYNYYKCGDILNHIKLKARTVGGSVVDKYIPNYYIQCFYYSKE